MPWYMALNLIKPYVFKISTPRGSGTGFQISYYKNRKLCGIATAYHVIKNAAEWGEPIKIVHYESGKSIMLKENNRVIIPYPKKDLAFIVFNHKEDIPIKLDAPELIGSRIILKQGVQIGWCGFPAVAPENLCFFNGYTSCYLEAENYYLVDGVAINGVSGGPAFYIFPRTNQLKICGVISAYIPNRIAGETLPGLCVVTSVESYQETLKNLKSLDEAEEEVEKQKIEVKKEQKEKKKKSSKIAKKIQKSRPRRVGREGQK